MRLLILTISVLWIFSCKPSTTIKDSTDEYFDLPKLSQQLLSNQVTANTDVVKTAKVNGVEEIQSVEHADSAFWATELFQLLGGNLNKPSLVGSYNIKKGIPEQSSNLTTTIYTAKPESKTTIKKLTLKYLGTQNEIRQVQMDITNENSVYITHQTIELWVNKYGSLLLIDSMITEGYNKTIMLDSMRYTSKVNVIR